MGFLENIFGSKNKRTLKKLQPLVHRIGELGRPLEDKSDAELRAMTGEFKQRIENGASLDDVLPEAFALVREAGTRVLKMTHFDVQLIGGIILHRGTIAEMRTGEGKTLVATLPSYLNALSGNGVHVVTVNDYLARRDSEWMGQLHRFLGLSVGVVVHGLDDLERQKNYGCDITYGQNNEFGFDYLRDNMKMSPDRMVQRGLNYAIVDEVDSILIDEARTPLIISGPAEESADLYTTVDRIVPKLKADVDYTVDEKDHVAMLTDQGVEHVEKLLGLKNLYDADNLTYIHHVNQALRAHTLYKRDVNYLIEEGKVLIIDEFTGRKMPGRRWSDGLHQAIEAKEGVTIEEENQTLATVTFQNYFRMYDKLSGMTGTADTEAAEFHEIYEIDVVVIPTNKPMIRDDQADLVYKNERGKFKAVFEDIVDCADRGQPVLVGTTSVEKSEVISTMLKKKGLTFNVLNAKQHEREAHVVAQAGRKGAITISTNMAGRGTDIILGGNPEELAAKMIAAEEQENEADHYEKVLAELKEQCAAEREEVLAAGGLKIVGTERHESRRIDNQLRGRAGRQGDPGASRFYLSLEDDLLRIFGADRISGLMERLGMEEDVPIEHSWVSKAIQNAQKKVEGQNFDSRKNLLEYDDVMNQQRKTIYALRRQTLEGRYEPTLSEEEIKAGKKPDVPTTSGDWTVESLSKEMREEIEAMVERHLGPAGKNGEAERAADGERAVNGEAAADGARDASGKGDADGERNASGKGDADGERNANGKGDADARDADDDADSDAVSDADPSLDDEEEIPPWRMLRIDLWRQTGALCKEIEKRCRGPRDQLVDYILGEVASSQIQQRERIYDLCDGLIGAIVDKHCPQQTHADDWNFDGLSEALHDQFGMEFDLPDKIGDAQEIAEKVWEQVEKRLDEREEELSRPFFMYFGRHFFLEEIDTQWIDHLRAMDHLRDGIGLRGYGQLDPKQEYKKEGYELFEQMMQNIQTNACRNLFRVQIQREEAEIPALQAKQRRMTAVHPSADGSAGSSATGAAADGGEPPKQQTVRRTRPKVGRNDPCPCGSGKKYKKCHGRETSQAAV